jgi:hypothetical protein
VLEITRAPAWAFFGIRYGAVASWLGALVLFLLPWVEIKCVNDKGAGFHTTMSGAQIVLGEHTDHLPPDKIRRQEKPAPQAEDKEPKLRQVIGRYLLAVYGLLLIIGLGCLFIQPQKLRAVLGGVYALAVLVLPIAGMWLFWGHALWLPMSPILRYTYWYYGTHVANLLAILSFAIELSTFWEDPIGIRARSVS